MVGFIARMFPFVSILGLWPEPSYHRVCPLLSTVLILAPSCFVLPFNLKDVTTQHTVTVFITLRWVGMGGSFYIVSLSKTLSPKLLLMALFL